MQKSNTQNKIGSKYKLSRGFTLVEILVSTAIILVITSVVFWNQSSASQSVALSNNINQLSVLIREAQVYGVSVRVVEGSGGDTFDVSYGIHVAQDGDYVILFADKDGSQTYSGDSNCSQGASEECLNKYDLTSGISITDICGLWNNSERCLSSFSGLNSFDVLFTRPSPTADFQFLNSGGQPYSQFSNDYAKIKLSNNLNSCRIIRIYGTGQVTTNEVC